MKVQSLWNSQARREAVAVMRDGKPVGVYNRGVCAIWGDATNNDFVQAIISIKGEKRLNRPMGSTLLAEDFLCLVDKSHIPLDKREIFGSAKTFKNLLGSLCFVRTPILPDVLEKIPSSLVFYKGGVPFLQNWSPEGHRPTYLLIQEMVNAGIPYPAVTSMNTSGQPEIVDQSTGIAFASKTRIPLFLTDSRKQDIVKGSFSILGIEERQFLLIREGNIPGYILEGILQVPLQTSTTQSARYTQLQFPNNLLTGLSPHAMRIAAISFLHGWSSKQIHQALRVLNI